MDPATHSQVVSALKAAAGLFVRHSNERAQIHASSLDWFQQEWGRDTFISLPGILLATERFEEARSIIQTFARYERDGLIPNRISDPTKPETIEYNTVDGSMWFIQAINKYVEWTGDGKFLAEMLPVLRKILDAYRNGTRYHRLNGFHEIRMDQDGLIMSPAQATWMDADPDALGKPVTPRNGKAVEINALWYSNLQFLAEWETEGKAVECRELAARVKRSFNEKYWNESEGALYDVVDGDPHGGAIRPNMIFAVSCAGDLLPPERQRRILDVVFKDLLTPFGLRTLSPRDSHYRGRYETEKPPREKDLAYHQGSVWPWLMGATIDAVARVRKNEGKGKEEIQQEIFSIVSPLCEYFLTNPDGSLPELFDGDPPHHPGGTRSQAWSVAELLRGLVEHFG